MLIIPCKLAEDGCMDAGGRTTPGAVVEVECFKDIWPWMAR